MLGRCIYPGSRRGKIQFAQHKLKRKTEKGGMNIRISNPGEGKPVCMSKER